MLWMCIRIAEAIVLTLILYGQIDRRTDGYSTQKFSAIAVNLNSKEYTAPRLEQLEEFLFSNHFVLY